MTSYCKFISKFNYKARVIQRNIYLMMIVMPVLVKAQSSSLELCYAKLLEDRKIILQNRTSQNQPFRPLFDSSAVQMQMAFNRWEECLEGQIIPSLDFVTIHGKAYNNSNLRGKVLVLNFWFKSCIPCVAEMPSLNKLSNEFKGKDVIFIGFATDKEESLKSDYLSSEKFLFDIVPNSSNIVKQFSFFGFPTTYVVDQNGKIVKAWSGYKSNALEPYNRAKPVIELLLSK